MCILRERKTGVCISIDGADVRARSRKFDCSTNKTLSRFDLHLFDISCFFFFFFIILFAGGVVSLELLLFVAFFTILRSSKL